MSRTVAIVPAFNRQDTVGETVRSLQTISAIDEVIVVDDGSSDDTSGEAEAAGATVARLDRNVGKGGAVAHGVELAGEPCLYLLLDADLGETAHEVSALLAPVVSGEAAMTIATFPAEGRSEGFGFAKRAAASIIERTTGLVMSEPLSGQRVVAGSVLRSLDLAPRFGLEVGLTLDIATAGERVVEVPAAFSHRATGRDLHGLLHRARQGRDLMAASARRIGWRPTVASVLASVLASLRRSR